LDSWATANNLELLYDPKEAASFSSHRWNVGINPDLASASIGQDNRLPDRRVLGKYPGSQCRPSYKAAEAQSSCPSDPNLSQD